MGGPCKDKPRPVYGPDDKFGKHANPRRKRHPNASCLDQRIGGFEKAQKNSPKYDLHQPGSEKK